MQDSETLLAHATFLEGLARALITDPGRADDLVQDTWLAAIRRPPRETSRARSWLARVLRNTAVTQHRRETRREARERSVARSVELRSDRGHRRERETLARRVADAVFRLAEPYRATLLYRYYEDMTPAEIAARQGIPVETVRTRLKRGLARLRDTLDRRHGGKRAAWSAGLVAAFGLEFSRGAGSATSSSASVASVSKIVTTGGMVTTAKSTVLSFSAAIVFAVCSGFLYVQLSAESDIAAEARDARDRLAREAEALRTDIGRLRGELSNERSRSAEMDRRRTEERRARLAAEATVANAAIENTASNDEASEVEPRDARDPLVEKGDWSRTRHSINNLAHVRSEESTEYLIELLERTPAETKLDIVRSLIWHRNPASAAAVRRAREATTNPKHQALMDAALRLLDGLE